MDSVLRISLRSIASSSLLRSLKKKDQNIGGSLRHLSTICGLNLTLKFSAFLNIYLIFYMFSFLLDSSRLIWNGKPPKGKVVFTLTYPTKDSVQTITLPEKTTGRTVSLLLPGKKEMRFREVEVYNGPLLGKHYNGQIRETDDPW